jgi:hypothetical protein
LHVAIDDLSKATPERVSSAGDDTYDEPIKACGYLV